MASSLPRSLALTTANPMVRRTVEGAHSLARLFGVLAVVALFGGGAMAVEAFKSSQGAFLSTSAPHVMGIVIGTVTLVVSAIFGFFGYVLLLLRVLVEHTTPVGAISDP